MGDQDGDARYWAFISYSHKDAAFGRRLHKKLEAYAVPRRLVGRMTAHGPAPRRLTPIFRDRDELSASHDLSSEVRAALKASRSLIVICSPAAAASQWVAREVEAFRELHPDRPVLAVIRDGEPPDCFPPPLRALGSDGAAIEPLAADFRRAADGEHLGLLKLVSGVLGLGLDELVQRDAHRRMQRVTAITAGAVAAMLVMGVLTLFAVDARFEAERQRGQAEGLVEYMLTDLRDKLKGVGRLDVMTAVNERALHYYAGQDLDMLPVDSLERRARIYHAWGEDDETRGDYDKALAKFREAYRTTERLLALAPNDPERIFDHAQSEYWFGLVDYDLGHFARAHNAFRAYQHLTDRLIALQPTNTKYRKEASYAEGNLCSVAYKERTDKKAAVRHCAIALTLMEEAARHPDAAHGSPEERRDTAKDLLNRLGWMGDAYRADDQPARAKSVRLREERMLSEMMKTDPKDMDLRDTWTTVQRAIALLEIEGGEYPPALARLNNALGTINEMIKHDPSNMRWQKIKQHIFDDLDRIPEKLRKKDGLDGK